MQQENLLSGFEEKKMSSTLNVLTILTFIGCGIGLLSSIWSYISIEKSYEQMQKMQNDPNMAQMPGFVKSMINEDALKLLKLQVENKLPMTIIAIIGIVLCIWGALKMRKLEKQGFYFWLLGEIVPIIGTLIFIGFSVFKGFAMIALIFPLVFVILYATQLKDMK